jgi:opacity protein-like surface antigen
MSRHPGRWSGKVTYLGAVAAAAALTIGSASKLQGQQLYATPEVGWSDLRGVTVGGRAGVAVVAGLDVALQGLLYFPDESGVADPGVGVDRSAWQVSTNALYVFDRTRAIAPYVGAGVRYGKASLTLVVDGVRASREQGDLGANVLGGVRFPRLPAHPFLEVRWGDETWTLTVGVLPKLRAR